MLRKSPVRRKAFTTSAKVETKPMNDDKRLSEIRERCEKATRGEWGYAMQDGWPCVTSFNGQVVTTSLHCTKFSQREDDVRFIAHARSDIPYLLEKITALEAKLAEAVEERDTYKRLREAAHEQLDAAVGATANALKVAPLTEDQRKALAYYCADYLQRGIHGVWHELATGIAALLKHAQSQDTELSTLRRQVEEARRFIQDVTFTCTCVSASVNYDNHDSVCVARRARSALQQLAQRGEGK